MVAAITYTLYLLHNPEQKWKSERHLFVDIGDWLNDTWLNCALLLAPLSFRQRRVQRRDLRRYVTKQRDFQSISVRTSKRTTLNLVNNANSVHNLFASFTILYRDTTKHRTTLTYFRNTVQWLCILRLLLFTYIILAHNETGKNAMIYNYTCDQSQIKCYSLDQ
jgi:hypothetical protein